ncbi:MAG: restriction endonuclease [Methanobacterium sp.]|nr:restriction endonuclease [Methanobacterium sp.]
MEKNRLVDFVAKIMEKSGFKVQKYYKTTKYVVDIYGVLPTVLGDIGIVVACKNYEERWKVGLDVIKEMEMVAKTLNASKVVIITTSTFSDNAVGYAQGRNVELIDKDELMRIAKSLSNKKIESYEDAELEEEDEDDDYDPSFGSKISGSFPKSGKRSSLSGRKRSVASNKLQAWGKVILSSTAALILIVLAISTVVTYLVAPNRALLGVLRIVIAAILSYGIVIAVERDLTVTLIKGSTVFFVCLMVYIALIIFT